MKKAPLMSTTGAALKMEIIRHHSMPHTGQISERHRNAFHRILFIQKGTAQLEVDFSLCTVGPSEVMIIPQGAVEREEDSSAWAGMEIRFSDAFFAPGQRELLQAFMQYAIASRKLLIPILAEHAQPLAKYVELLGWEAHQPENQNQTFILQNLMLALLNRLEGMIQHLPEEASFIERRMPFQKFINLVETHYLTHKGLEFYVSELQLTSRKLNDILKELTGQTATHFIIDRIMLDARRELCFSEKSVKEIAYQLGYDNPFYFSRIFKKRTQMSPEQFRQQFAE